MRVEKNGFILELDGTRVKISNKYGVQEYGETAINQEDIPETYAESKLEEFILKHSVMEIYNPERVKRVAFDEHTESYIQLQAVLPDNAGYWMVQRYDSELVYMGEQCSGCKDSKEVQDWMCSNFNVQKCLNAYVFRNSTGDGTNGGISSKRQSLYILSTDGPFEPADIRECVRLEYRDIFGEQYIYCKPVYFGERWYMMGGNFIYSSDSSFNEISKYPIPIHDRYIEG